MHKSGGDVGGNLPAPLLIGDQVAIDGSDAIGLAGDYWAAGRTQESIAIQERIAANFARLHGPDHPNTLTAQRTLTEARALAAEASRSD